MSAIGPQEVHALSGGKPARLALLWRGDRAGAARTRRRDNNRFHRVFEELAALGIHAEPAVYAEDFADEVREQLLAARWRARLGRSDLRRADRTALDALLRDVASRGLWVSAHPDVILKMGVKEVLHRTKHLGWGTDTHLYRTAAAFRDEFPPRLRSAGPRVLKQNRGNGGQGVWKVELVSELAGAARSFACCMRDGAACPRTCRSAISWPLRGVFRRRRLHRGSAVSAAPARRHDPLLHGRRQGRRLRAPVHQGADPAAARRSGFAGGAAGSTHHAPGAARGHFRRCGRRWKPSGRRR